MRPIHEKDETEGHILQMNKAFEKIHTGDIHVVLMLPNGRVTQGS